jgi:hypothetical protein
MTEKNKTKKIKPLGSEKRTHSPSGEMRSESNKETLQPEKTSE